MGVFSIEKEILGKESSDFFKIFTSIQSNVSCNSTDEILKDFYGP